MNFAKTEIPENKTPYKISWKDNGKNEHLFFLAALEMDKQLASVVIFMRHYHLHYRNSNRDQAERDLEALDVANIKGHEITKLTFKKCGI